MSKIRVKSATKRDVPQIIQLIREFAEYEKLLEFCEATEEKLRAAMFGERPCVEGLVAFDAENKGIGYALFYENFASFRGQRGVYLEDLYVVPEMRKAGVGLALMKYLAKLAKERGCERMDWQVLTWNEPAIRFYELLGAEIDESERHWKLTGVDFERLANVDG
ncbi:MAG TPA: GNAT family N-acetyltransferase [Pyrinomonadaceae bacterium]|jgi:GNAT superfamily N-acetyltransferase